MSTDHEIRYCTTTDGVRIAYHVTGSGPPLVRALGFFTHLEFEETGPIFKPWLTCLSRDHQFVRYDGRNCGLSDRPSLDFSLASKVRDLEAVVAALNVQNIDLVGTSEGGQRRLPTPYCTPSGSAAWCCMGRL